MTDFTPLKSIKDIEGEYDNYPENLTKYQYETIHNIINWKVDKADTSKFLSVTIRADAKTLEFISHKITGQSLSRRIKYKLKANGFLHLRNHNYRITGVPLIFGGYNLKKIEVGLTKDRNLIINGVEESAGSMLIIIGSSLPKENFKYIYKRK